MTDGKILRPSFGDPKVIVDRTTERHCAHEYVALMHRSRTVKCRVCGDTVDAFEVLERLARSWEICTYRQEEIEAVMASLEQLKAEERNIKARIRKGRAVAPEPKAALYFEECMRRINAVNTRNDLWEVQRWAIGFKWLDARQEAALKEAEIRAKRRIEDNGRKRRRRHVEVIDDDKPSESKTDPGREAPPP